MGKFIDLTNQRFGRWTAVEQAGRTKNGTVLWKCLCECGKEKIVRANHLVSGATKSCGCEQGQVADLQDKRFGRLTVRRQIGSGAHGSMRWLCQCDCGNQVDVISGNLISGSTQSCGCFFRESTAERNRVLFWKHGHNTKTSPTYRSWASMIARCLNPKNKRYQRYGGANPPVLVCDKWQGEHGFETFLREMGPRPKGTTLGRFLDIGPYSAENTAWQTDPEQKAEQKKKRELRKAA
jgi:hypothetical protein